VGVQRPGATFGAKSPNIPEQLVLSEDAAGGIDLSPVPGLGRGELEDGCGRRRAGDSPAGNVAAQVDHAAAPVEEEEIERKAHPKGVDAAAARDQQALARALAREQRKAEEAAGEGGRNWNRAAKDLGAPEAAESDRSHAPLRAQPRFLTPSPASSGTLPSHGLGKGPHLVTADAKGVEPGPDGKPRCWWCLGSEDLTAYHDEEWGQPLHGETELFERLTLEAFQSGLSWLTILRKRENFRRAFDGFDVERIAAYRAEEVKRLLADAGIVRNRMKIEATITNARAAREMHANGESLDELIWSFVQDSGSRPVPKTLADLEATTPESKALAKELKRRGFVFVGPTTAYSTMEAVGVVNDHLGGCAFR
jgi:DNA-3-methyladenine glycosylase I